MQEIQNQFPDTCITIITESFIREKNQKRKGEEESVTKTIRIRANTKLARIGLYLLRKGGVYKQDMLAYANRICSKPSDASTLIKELKKRDIITVRDFMIRAKRYGLSGTNKTESYYRKVRKAETVTLSDHGLIAMYQLYVTSANVGDPAPRAYFEKLRQPFLADITQLSDSAYRKVLDRYNVNRLKTIFNLCGAYTEPLGKPCLEEIYCYRNGLEYEGENSEGYRLYQDRGVLDTILDAGIYYTIEEYRKFYARYEDGAERFTTVARGIYISNSLTLVVYANGKGNKSMIYCPNQTSEQRIIQALKNENLSHRVSGKNTSTSKSKEVHALLVGESESFIYSSASGKKFGRTTKGHKNDNYLKTILTPYSNVFIEKDPSSNRQDYYSGMYCIAYSHQGIKQLQKLLTQSSQMSSFYRKLIEKRPDRFAKDQGNREFPILYLDEDDEWKSCCYIPCYELIHLAAIRQQKAKPVIIADPSMHGIIQRITHQKHLFLDPEEYKPDTSTVLTIDENGYPAGKKIIDDYLHSNHKRTDKAEYSKAAERYGLDVIEFFNAVAEERIDVEEVAEGMILQDYDPAKYVRQAKKIMSVSKDCYEKIVELAARKNTTIYHVTNMLLKKALSEIPDAAVKSHNQET